MEKKLWSIMDKFFVLLIEFTGEKENDVNISHIL